MKTYFIISLIGDDRPGLVESLSQVIADYQGNWLESSMSQLAGKFAGILKVSVDETMAAGLQQALNGLSAEMRLLVERVDLKQDLPAPQTVSLSLVGNDHPGIIKEITHALTAAGVNVEQLTTSCEAAPMSAAALFRASASLRVPNGLDLERLQSDLERLANDLIVDIQLGSL